MSTDTWLLIVILALSILSLLSRSGDQSARLAALDRKFDLILKNLGINPSDGLDPQLENLVRDGEKIEAIKLYRTQTGVGLKEAKEYVEGLTV